MQTHPEVLDVPFVDLRPANSAVKQRVLARIGETLDKGDFINGEAVREFEVRFAELVGRKHCVGVSSGLDALRLGLLASGLTPGAQVIVPAATFAATLEAVLQAGGTPVLVDVGEEDYGLDVAQATAAAAAGATYVMPVHLYGQMADMRALVSMAEGHGLRIVEDACQAHGATRDGIVSGGSGAAAAFSFYPSKNLGAIGDAGALVTDDDELAARGRALRQHGETSKYHHEYVGYTARLDTIQAIVLAHKLPLLDGWNEQRRAAAALYSEALAGIGDIELPPVAPDSNPVWHLYVIRTADPHALALHLRERQIGTGFHYPEPAHLSKAYRSLGHAAGSFPVAEETAGRVISLPIFPGITEAQIEAVVDGVKSYF